MPLDPGLGLLDRDELYRQSASVSVRRDWNRLHGHRTVRVPGRGGNSVRPSEQTAEPAIAHRPRHRQRSRRGELTPDARRLSTTRRDTTSLRVISSPENRLEIALLQSERPGSHVWASSAPKSTRKLTICAGRSVRLRRSGGQMSRLWGLFDRNRLSGVLKAAFPDLSGAGPGIAGLG